MIDKRKRRTQKEMAELREAILEEAALGEHAHTVRHLFYRLVSRGLIQKTEAEYDNVAVRLCGELREDGTLPWDWIIDETRWMRRSRCYSSVEEAVEACAKFYRRDALAKCDDYLEIWCEKNTLTGILSEVTEKYDVPLMVSVGFSSKGFLHDTALTIFRNCMGGKPTFIYQVGDNDPSGHLAWEAIQKSILRYLIDLGDEEVCDAVHFERLALTELQIQEFDLPTRPTKGGQKKNTHAKNFAGESTEVDAMDTDDLLRIVESAIQRHIPEETLEQLRVTEESERELIKMWKA
jgi:hypothetical protein